MTTKDGYYGSDAVENKFSDPDTNESYFTLVNEKTGEIEIYNEKISDEKRVATMETDGSVVYNNDWLSSATERDEQFIDIGVMTGSIKNHAAQLVNDESGLTPTNARSLLGNSTEAGESPSESTDGLSTLPSGQQLDLGEDRAGTRNKFGNHVFPKSIDPGQDVLKFNMMKYVPKKFDQKTFGFEDRAKNTRGRSIGSVILPIPAGIGDAQAVSWGGNSMSAVQAALAQAALAAISNPQEGVESLLDSAKTVAKNSGEVGTALANTLAGMASGNQNLITRTTGAILNPNLDLLFQAPTLRPFNFNFSLSPRDPKEAETVMKIIRFFKQGMSPIRSKSNLFLKSPHTFQLQYLLREGRRSREHPFINKFKECALQSFGVQYTPTGNYSTFSDGVMTQYNISMTFTELEPVFNDDYGDQDLAEIGF